MAKRKSKKKQQSPADILARAETLFNKKSYQAALKEYEKYVKLHKNSIQEMVAGHIRICKQETAATRARELVKKARRLLKKDNPAQALVFFEQAYAITGDSHLAGKIDELRVKSGDRDMAASADQAEDAGDYLTAAELLRQLHATHPDNSLLCRRARCLIMAGQWQQAVATYAEADCSATADLYNAGFALAREQKFADCLNHWQKIQSEHPDFLAQKETVHALLF
ncbi:MAG: tetratricopeptide repeat protein, partial [Desulfobulbaceae bacterium]|nr:tetratricopeptide repeat protein [Desulfobulbaceae bacterium]